MSTQYARLANGAQWLIRPALILMLVYLAALTLLWPGPDREPSAVIWVILSLPWLVIAPGIWRGSLHAHAAMCFISLVYFASAVTNVFMPGRVPGAVVELVLTVILFCAGTMFIRWRARANRQAAASAQGEHDE